MKKGTMAAEAREAGTKGNLRKLRTGGRVPGVLYGAGAETVSVSVLEKDVQTALRSGVRILEMRVGKEAVSALLKDVEYDHLGERVIHVDFQRLRKGETIEIRVPLVYRGVPAGAKTATQMSIE